MLKVIFNRTWIFIFSIIIFLAAASFVSAATKYWVGTGVNLAIHSDTIFIIDTANNRVGIGDSTPDYLLDVEATGNAAAFYSLLDNSDGLKAVGVTYGVYAVSSGTGGRAVFGYSSGSSSSYGIYGGTNSNSGYSGYFTGGSGLYADGNETYHAGNCRYVSAQGGESITANCAGAEEVTGGGCYCSCGDNRLMYSKPNTGLTQWQCGCANCGSGAYAYAICCGA